MTGDATVACGDPPPRARVRHARSTRTRRLGEGGASGVAVVVEDAAGAADGDLVRAIRAAGAHGRVRVDAAERGLVRRAGEADVAVLAPGRAPAVANEPVVLAVVGAVAHQLNTVVELRRLLVAASVDAARVRGPGGGVDGDGDRALGGDCMGRLVDKGVCVREQGGWCGY